MATVIARPEHPALHRDRAATTDPHRKTATQTDQVFKAAQEGRVEAAFLRHDSKRSGHLLDEIAAAVTRHGGRVWVLDDAPTETHALLRY